MNARDFLDQYGTIEAERIALEAGTTLAYFKQIAYGNRFPSRKLAQRLAKASGGRMDVLRLLNVAA